MRFTDVKKEMQVIKHYFTQSVKSGTQKGNTRTLSPNCRKSEVSNCEERYSEVAMVDEYWKSHRRITNPICFVAVNDHKQMSRFKIMALDTHTQSLTPLCMTDMIQNQVRITRQTIGVSKLS